MIVILPGDYGDNNDGMQRCPASSPTWCICKWATANWIKGEGCNEVGHIFYNAAGLYLFLPLNKYKTDAISICFVESIISEFTFSFPLSLILKTLFIHKKCISNHHLQKKKKKKKLKKNSIDSLK